MNKVQRLIDVAHLLVDQLDKVNEDSIGIYMNAKIHGVEYNGATYEHELKALRKILAEFSNETVDNNTVDKV